MKCTDLARCIERIRPEAHPRDVARLCLLLANGCSNLDELGNDAALISAWKEMELRMQAVTDQHAAMTEELDNVARSDPKRFTPAQIWMLIRVIKVQSQMLQLYVGQSACTV